ncbi:capsule biosynthesis GfcC family protein [Halomonas sp. KM-1]|uniref:capsule biosynthesis GfcC family protein n=1 Tax=Halomonas sp. KM-1 TaxID=590061 RepID=UPI000288F119|nr:capsule biosynthesis GfcC family protein [Halomonas sp. KM-1]
MTQRHHARARRRSCTSLGTLLILTLSLAAKADTPTLSRLWLEQPTQPEASALAYYLLHVDREAQRHQGLRLGEELTTLADWHALAGHAELSRGLHEWRTRIEELQAHPSRTLARADLAALLASPRHDPALDSLAAAGTCALPDWVEFWHFGGVTRQRWQPGMDLRGLLRERSRGHWSAADEAWVLPPQGAPRRVGVAAWNAGNLPLAAGSRVVLIFPDPVQEATWVNRALPDYLATRLPSDACSPLTLPADEQTTAEQTATEGITTQQTTTQQTTTQQTTAGGAAQ